MDLQCGKQRQMVKGAVCLLACTHTHTHCAQHNKRGEEIPKAHYACCRSLTQAKGLSSFVF